MFDENDFPFLPPELARRHWEYSRAVFQHLTGRPWKGPWPTPPAPEEFAVAAEAAAADCDRLLKLLSPDAALSPWNRLESTTRLAPHNIGFQERVRWVLAVAATGTSSDPADINSFIGAAIHWWDAEHLADTYRRSAPGDEELSISVDALPGREFLTRTTSTTIRYHWACRKIVNQIAREAQADADFANLLPEFTIANVDAMFDAAHRYREGATPITVGASQEMELAALMAIDAGTLSSRKFNHLARSSQMQIRPWVRFSDRYLLCSPFDVLMSLERPLLAAADDRLTGSKRPKIDKGELFERAARSTILDAIGHRHRNPSRSYDIKIPGKPGDHDVDIAVVDRTVRLIGEVKAMEVTDQVDGASNAFGEQVRRVYEQLHQRLNALDSGVPLISPDGQRFYGEDPIALGAVLHPYSNSLRDPRMLQHVTGDAATERIAVADVHSWVLILHGLEDLDDLRCYLRFREDLFEIQAVGIEECDIALPYFSPIRDSELARMQNFYAHRDPSKVLLAPLQGWEVNTEIAVRTAAPEDWRTWRRVFFRDCNPLPWAEVFPTG